MKKINTIGLVTAFLAGASLMAMPAIAQDSGETKIPRLKQSGDAKTGGAESSAPTDPAKQGASDQGSSNQGSSDQGSSGKSTDSETTGADAPAETGNETAPKPNDNSASDVAPGRLQGQGAVDSATEAAPGQQQKSGEVDDASEAAPGQTKGSKESSADVEISSEQKVEIRNVISEVKVEPVTTDVDVKIGVEVPRTIELHPLPPRIVEIVPAYEGYQFFILPDGRIVIVEPDTYQVVYILTV